MPARQLKTLSSLALASSLFLGACSRDEITHFKVPKSGGPPAGAPMQPPPGMPPGMGAGQQAPPGMQGDVPPPPAPERGMHWTLPKGWTEERTGGMRYATLKAPVQGKADGSVVVLPGPAGGELSNVNRWRGQIGLAPIDDAALAAARKVMASKAGKISFYDFTSDGPHQEPPAGRAARGRRLDLVRQADRRRGGRDRRPPRLHEDPGEPPP